MKWVALENPLVAGDMVDGNFLFDLPTMTSEVLRHLPCSAFQLTFADVTGARFVASNTPSVDQRISLSEEGIPVGELGNSAEFPSNEVEESGPRLGGAAAL
jgi:hypothetical protein